VKIARITNDGKLLIKGEVIKKDKEITTSCCQMLQLMPNGDLIIYGELVEKVVPLPPEDEIWIYGTFTTTYEIGQLLGGWASNVTVVDFYYDDDHYVIKASGTHLGEGFCQVFNTNGNTVIFGSRFSLARAFQFAPKATFIILHNAIAIQTQGHCMRAKKIYVPDNLLETYLAQTEAIAGIGEVLPLSKYTTVMPRITSDGTLVLGELIEGCAIGRIPQEFQEVAYIQSTGTQYIDTGIIGKGGLESYVEAEFTTVPGDGTLLGSRSWDTRLYLIHSYPSRWCYGYGGYYCSNSLIVKDTKYSIYTKLYNGNQEMRVNDIIVLNNSVVGDFNTNLNMFIFALNSNGSPNYPVSAKLYSAKLIENGVLTRDFIPCYRKVDGVIGLYDLVTNEFFTNKGTGVFLKGVDII